MLTCVRVHVSVFLRKLTIQQKLDLTFILHRRNEERAQKHNI